MDALAVTAAPGLIGALLVGVSYMKGLALAAKKPLVPVHHLRSHIAANYITFPDLEPPFLCLVVSGGHSHIIEVKSWTDLHVIGRTRDDAAGEAFDKAARAMGMPYPGGVEMDRVAETGNDKAFSLPRPSVDGAPYDFQLFRPENSRDQPAAQRGPARRNGAHPGSGGFLPPCRGGVPHPQLPAGGARHGRENARDCGRRFGQPAPPP